jgi:DOCK N-terminus
MHANIQKKIGAPVRRPFGCAVLALEGNVNVHVVGTKHKLAEHTVPIYATSQESLFPTLHERTPFSLPLLPLF